MSDIDPMALFDSRRFHSKVVEVGRKLFVSGHFEQAVNEAFKAVENAVREKSGRSDLYGQDLMSKVFNEDDPILRLNQLRTISEKDEQVGFKFIFMGVVRGIRNPRAHDTLNEGDAELALEYLALASLLLRRLDGATSTLRTDELIAETKKKTFVRSTRYIDALLDKIQPQLYTACIQRMVDLYCDNEQDESIRENALAVYRRLCARIETSSDEMQTVVGIVTAVLDEDKTFDSGIKFLLPSFLPLMENHVQEKVYGILVQDLKAGTLNHRSTKVTGAQYAYTLVEIQKVVPEDHWNDICGILLDLLETGSFESQGFAAWALHSFRDSIPIGQIDILLTTLVRALTRQLYSFAATEEVSRHIASYPEHWIHFFANALLKHDGETERLTFWAKEALKNPLLYGKLKSDLNQLQTTLSSQQARQTTDESDEDIPF